MYNKYFMYLSYRILMNYKESEIATISIILTTICNIFICIIKISLVDKGALDCTIKARIECAVLRACEASDKNIAWGGMIK